jgi:DNA-directed RNA polymerase specialized sigma24 family protein
MEQGDYTPRELRDLWELTRRVAAAKGSPDPQDVAQEVMFKLSKLKKRPDKPEAWVRRAAKNHVIDDWREAERRPNEVAPDLGVSKKGDAARNTVDWLMQSVPTSAAGMQSAAYAWLERRLAEVFTDQEIRLLSMVGAGVPQAEIAERMGYKNAAVVKTTLARLRKKADGLDRAELARLLNHPHAY